MTSRCKVIMPEGTPRNDGYENHMLEVIKIYSPFMVGVADAVFDYGKKNKVPGSLCYKMLTDIMAQGLGSLIGSVAEYDTDILDIVSNLKGRIVDSAMRSIEERERNEQEAGGSEG